MEVANGPASGPASAEDPNTGLQGPLAPKASRAFMALGLDELEVPGDGSEHSGSQDDVEEYYDDDDSYYTEDEEGSTWYEYIRWYANYYMDGSVVTTVMLVATFYALYGADLRLAAFAPSADLTFAVLSLICLILFALELGVGTWAKPGYAFSFFWYLDILATLSLVLDVPWIFDPLAALATDGDATATSSAADSASAARAARAARAGTRAGRIIRVVRLLRLIKFGRVLKLLRYYSALWRYRMMSKAEQIEAQRPVAPVLVVAEKVPASSMAGQILSEQITKQTIAGVLVFIIVFPFLNVDALYGRSNYELQAASGAVEVALGGADAATLAVLRERLLTFWKCLRFEAPGFAINNAARLAELRPGVEVEAVRFFVEGGPAEGYEALFDVSADSVLAASYSMGFTSFIILLLGTAVFVFNQVSNKYCIQPIESIMQMMRDFSDNPLDKMKTNLAGAKGKGETQSETSGLLVSIAKIAGLLQIGFGEAGAAIIGANLAKGGEINPMSAGRKMIGLFGFVVIFSFADTTEALREGVMLYVNRVAAIVHACVHEFAGAINKNIGEAFLMVWPLEHRTEKREKLRQKRNSVGSVNSSAPHSPARPSSPMRSPSRAHRGSTGSVGSAVLPADRRTSNVAPGSPDRRASGRGTAPNSPSRVARDLSAAQLAGAGAVGPGGVSGGGASAEGGRAGGRERSPSKSDRRHSGEPRERRFPKAQGLERTDTGLSLTKQDSGSTSGGMHPTSENGGSSSPPRFPTGDRRGSGGPSHDRRGSGTPLPSAIPEDGRMAAVEVPAAGRGEKGASEFVKLSELPDAPMRPGFSRNISMHSGGSNASSQRNSVSSLTAAAAAVVEHAESGPVQPQSHRRWGANSTCTTRFSIGGTAESLGLPSGMTLGALEVCSATSSPLTTPPESPERVGYRVDSRVGVPPSPGMRETLEYFYVLPQGTETFTTADCAVAGFALCVLLVRGNRQLQQLCQNEALQKMHPGFGVNTGYGLHMGWAIEGAIGSTLKIDASYLSPNVNLASRLEAATKQYHVRILLSEQVASVMSPKCRGCLRKVDRVTVKGSARPITLYTLDIAEDETNLRLAEALDPTVLPSDEQAEAEERALREKISTLHAMEDDGTDADLVDPEQFEAEKEALKELDQEARMFKRTNAIFEMRRTTTEEFMEAWDEALRLYLGGKWPEAIVCFRKCKALVPDDGPTDTLMTYLERRNCEAPAGWNGVRELTSK